MSQPAGKGPCINEGCGRERRTLKPGPCKRCYDRSRIDYVPRFPVTPLREYAEKRGVYIDDLPEKELTLERMDSLCIDVLGVHPHEVYGNFYFNAA